MIPAGTHVALSHGLTHSDEIQYNDPTKFDPSRFSVERSEDKQNSGWIYIPHGTGVAAKSHRCPAELFTTQVLKVFASALSTNHWEATGDMWKFN